MPQALLSQHLRCTCRHCNAAVCQVPRCSPLPCCSDYALQNKLIGPLMHQNLKLVRPTGLAMIALHSCGA